MELEHVAGFDREQWATCHIATLERGDIFHARGQVEFWVVTTVPEPYEDTDDPTQWVRLDVWAPDVGQQVWRTRADTPVVVRCDTRAAL
ncbi:hypothetical protein ACMA1D_10865 [Streptomyces sp. 796.1]|uniref:hypothetical protein n=1 Tax=Streptomyces sp. 796.1 TaxID=3163029 RepID=UPI0039C9C412